MPLPQCLTARDLPDKKTVHDYQRGVYQVAELERASGRTLDRELHHRPYGTPVTLAEGLRREKACGGSSGPGCLDIREKVKARTLSRKLLRALSSMYNGRGLPDKKAIDDYLKWEI